MKNVLGIALGVLVLLGSGFLASYARQAEDTPAHEPVTVFLVRHAEKAPAPANDRDPGLTEEGVERAHDLARLLSKAGVTHLFTSQYARTRATLEPLAKTVALEIATIPAQEDERQVATLRELPAGSVAVVAGHSNTVPALVEALDGEVRELTSTPPHGMILGDDEYDRLFVVILPVGKRAATQTIELRYGD